MLKNNKYSFNLESPEDPLTAPDDPHDLQPPKPAPPELDPLTGPLEAEAPENGSHLMKGSPVYPRGQLQMALLPLWTSHLH